MIGIHGYNPTLDRHHKKSMKKTMRPGDNISSMHMDYAREDRK